MKKSVIAIDGPAGAGKSTIAKMAAKKLNYIYIDTGAMYRGVAWLVLQKYQVPVNTAQVLSVIEDINIPTGTYSSEYNYWNVLEYNFNTGDIRVINEITSDEPSL